MTSCLSLAEGRHKNVLGKEIICLDPWRISKERLAIKANMHHQDRVLSYNAT